jgi:hypothetical protein
MNGENRSLVADEPIEVEKITLKVQNFRKITEPVRGIYRIHLKLIEKSQKITTHNRLDLETLGFVDFFLPIMSKNLPGQLMLMNVMMF